MEFQDLPPEIRILIFDYLDFVSRINCTLVCHDWNNLAMGDYFLNEHVLINIRCRGSFLSTRNRKEPTLRYLACDLLQSARNYKLMCLQYFIGAPLRLNSVLSLCRKFNELTYLGLEQKYERIHILSLKQIVMTCAKLETLKLNVLLVRHKPSFKNDTLVHNLKQLILASVNFADFTVLTKMFSTVPALRLENMQYCCRHTKILIDYIPNLCTLDLVHVYFFGANPFCNLKQLEYLHTLIMVSARFSGGFIEWPNLSPSVQHVAVRKSVNIQLMNQLRDRWGHVKRFELEVIN